MRYHLIIPAAGNGFRFGGSLPKQYMQLHGKPVLQHALDALRAGFPSAHAYVVIAPDDRRCADVLRVDDGMTVLRCGGATRAQTVRNALDLLPHVEDDDWVVVHDAVRPCLDRASSLRLQSELAHDPVGGFLAVPVSDTLKRIGDGQRALRTESRDGLWRAQTPQMFRHHVLHHALGQPGTGRWTDEAHAVEASGLHARAVLGNACNVKVTYPDDLELASAILRAQAPHAAAHARADA